MREFVCASMFVNLIQVLYCSYAFVIFLLVTVYLFLSRKCFHHDIISLHHIHLDNFTVKIVLSVLSPFCIRFSSVLSLCVCYSALLKIFSLG